MWGRGMQTSLCGARDKEAPFVDSRPVMTSSPETRYSYIYINLQVTPLLDSCSPARSITAYCPKSGSLWSVVTSSLPLNSLSLFG